MSCDVTGKLEYPSTRESWKPLRWIYFRKKEALVSLAVVQLNREKKNENSNISKVPLALLEGDKYCLDVAKNWFKT